LAAESNGRARSSFRDPAGSLHVVRGRVFRTVSPQAAIILDEFLGAPGARALVESGKLISTRAVQEDEAPASELGVQAAEDSNGRPHIFEHERVWFPSYAYEWPVEMLYAAGQLTLDLATATLKQGFGLKDATPFNVLFRGPKPVFVDVLSFEKRESSDPRWLPYAQFLRTFVFPLLLAKEFGTGANEIFLANPGGLEPEQVYRRLNWLRRIRPPFLTVAAIPTWLNKSVTPDDKELYKTAHSSSPEKAQFILEMRFRAARKLLARGRPASDRKSVWSSYLDDLSYSSDEFKEKSQAVSRWMQDVKPATVLDIGCNTGHFSEIAAKTGARVVGVDLDPVVVGRTWQRATSGNLDILPLVVNLARPSPAVGWRNAEYPSFLARATGAFDAVIMLAVLHHLLVTERIPLPEIMDVAAELANKALIIEYVSKDDPMFQRLTRGREALHADFTQEVFEAECQRRFTIAEKLPVKGELRWLYLLRKNGG